MKVDFWQYSGDGAEKVVVLLAKRILAEGERLLVVSKDPDQRDAISRALWKAEPTSFLANGEAGEPGEDSQPILLSADLAPINGASHVVIADGEWRAASGFARVFLLFDASGRDAARSTWRGLDGTEGLERRYFAQEDGRWVQKG
ncbi:DNA polymerase III subunit chi [Qipengyuania nanhaisediminis]|uniref:DNA polymerase III subunit chi n=1 Tax=Qipengyuania nanhaisediminis TaxID=604088 RepID=UPI0038B3B579